MGRSHGLLVLDYICSLCHHGGCIVLVEFRLHEFVAYTYTCTPVYMTHEGECNVQVGRANVNKSTGGAIVIKYNDRAFVCLFVCCEPTFMLP